MKHSSAAQMQSSTRLVTRRYPKYASVASRWFDELPSSWDTMRAKWLFSNEKERSDKSDDQLAASQKYGVIPQQKMIELNNAKVMLALKGTENFKRVRRNDFVISLRSFQGGIEHSLYDGCISPAYTVLRRRSSNVEPNYFSYVLKCGPFIEALNSTSEGIRDGKTITYDEFGDLVMALPPKEDQLAIANYLDHEISRINDLIAEKQNFINLLKEKRQALISHIVTKGLNPKVKMKDSGIEWIGEIPESWVQSRLKYHVDRIIDTEHKTIPFVDDSDYLVVRTSDIREGELINKQCRRTDQESFEEWTQRGVPAPGDVILTREAPAGEACIVPGNLNVCLGQRTVLIRTRQSLLSEYLLLVIYSDITKTFIDNASMGSTVKHLNMADIPKIPVFVPDVDTQKAIVAFVKKELEKINSLRSQTFASIELLKEHRTALISAAVTGKIDVRNQA